MTYMYMLRHKHNMAPWALRRILLFTCTVLTCYYVQLVVRITLRTHGTECLCTEYKYNHSNVQHHTPAHEELQTQRFIHSGSKKRIHVNLSMKTHTTFYSIFGFKKYVDSNSTPVTAGEVNDDSRRLIKTQNKKLSNNKPNCKLEMTKKYVKTQTHWPIPRSIIKTQYNSAENIQALNSTQYQSSKLLPRALSYQQHADLVLLLESVSHLLMSMNITYYISDGTLLGSYVFHDVIPWDDDIDINIHVKDRDKLLHVFADEDFRTKYGVMSFHEERDLYEIQFLRLQNKMKTYTDDNIIFETRNRLKKQGIVNNLEDILSAIKDELTSCRSYLNKKFVYKHKIYLMSSKHAGGYAWRWPFIDVMYFNGNESHIWPIDHKSHVRFHLQVNVFPLVLRPFAGGWFPAPYDTEQFLRTKFREKMKCASGHWNHVNERAGKKGTTQCSLLRDFYPYVKRSLTQDGIVQEDLVCNTTVIYSVNIGQPFHTTSWFEL